jgi:EAL domain-containing protein (putative c-di-GMP-specific phosphodiesterase class I)
VQGFLLSKPLPTAAASALLFEDSGAEGESGLER